MLYFKSLLLYFKNLSLCTSRNFVNLLIIFVILQEHSDILKNLVILQEPLLYLKTHLLYLENIVAYFMILLLHVMSLVIDQESFVILQQSFGVRRFKTNISSPHTNICMNLFVSVLWETIQSSFLRINYVDRKLLEENGLLLNHSLWVDFLFLQFL